MERLKDVMSVPLDQKWLCLGCSLNDIDELISPLKTLILKQII